MSVDPAHSLADVFDLESGLFDAETVDSFQVNARAFSGMFMDCLTQPDDGPAQIVHVAEQVICSSCLVFLQRLIKGIAASIRLIR